jgi:hypothetical protein
MNVPVYKVFRFENLHEPKIGFKAPVTLVALVVYAPWRGMGQEYIQKPAVKDAVPQKPGNEPCYFQKHLKIRKLIVAVVITHRPAKARDYVVFFKLYPCPNVNRPTAKILPFMYLQSSIPKPPEILQFFYMVVPENKEKGFIQGGNDIIKVIQGKVPGGQNQVNIGKPLLDIGGINQGINLIGNTEKKKKNTPFF